MNGGCTQFGVDAFIYFFGDILERGEGNFDPKKMGFVIVGVWNLPSC